MAQCKFPGTDSISWSCIKALHGTDSTSRNIVNSLNGTDGTSWHSSALNCDYAGRTGEDGTEQIHMFNFRHQLRINIGLVMQGI